MYYRYRAFKPRHRACCRREGKRGGLRGRGAGGRLTPGGRSQKFSIPGGIGVGLFIQSRAGMIFRAGCHPPPTKLVKDAPDHITYEQGGAVAMLQGVTVWYRLHNASIQRSRAGSTAVLIPCRGGRRHRAWLACIGRGAPLARPCDRSPSGSKAKGRISRSA